MARGKKIVKKVIGVPKIEWHTEVPNGWGEDGRIEVVMKDGSKHIGQMQRDYQGDDVFFEFESEDDADVSWWDIKKWRSLPKVRENPDAFIKPGATVYMCSGPPRLTFTATVDCGAIETPDGSKSPASLIAANPARFGELMAQLISKGDLKPIAALASEFWFAVNSVNVENQHVTFRGLMNPHR